MEDEIYEEKSCTIKLIYYIFKLARVFYTSVYYYFFPFLYAIIPVLNLVNSGKIDNLKDNIAKWT